MNGSRHNKVKQFHKLSLEDKEAMAERYNCHTSLPSTNADLHFCRDENLSALSLRELKQFAEMVETGESD